MACSFMCSEIYDALMRCLLADIKPSSTTKQGLCQSLSYSGSYKERNLFFFLFIQGPLYGPPGEDEAAAKRVRRGISRSIVSLYSTVHLK